MIDLTPYLTTIVMLIGIVVGTLIGPKIQHRTGIEYNRKDLLFKRKLEYFEKIFETIEKNKRMYNQAMGKIECSKTNKDIKKIIEELKQTRKNFFMMASPLYFDVRALSDKIVRFVRVEKEIFNRISSLINKDKKEILILVEQIKNITGILNKRADEIIIEMKKELSK